MKQIQLKTNAIVSGVLRSPGEGAINVPAAEAERVIDEGKAAEVDAKDEPDRAASKKAR